MIFHTPDPTFKRLLSCWRRAEHHAMVGKLDKTHKLAAAWENAKMFIEAEEDDGVVNELMKLLALDWFALKVEEFSQSNNIMGDVGLSHILYEWKEFMPIHPAPLVRRASKYNE